LFTPPPELVTAPGTLMVWKEQTWENAMGRNQKKRLATRNVRFIEISFRDFANTIIRLFRAIDG
jgi:hypothetical protein